MAAGTPHRKTMEQLRGGCGPNGGQRRKGPALVETLRILPPPKFVMEGSSEDTTSCQIGGVTHSKSNLKIFNGQDSKGRGHDIMGQ